MFSCDNDLEIARSKLQSLLQLATQTLLVCTSNASYNLNCKWLYQFGSFPSMSNSTNYDALDWAELVNYWAEMVWAELVSGPS